MRRFFAHARPPIRRPHPTDLLIRTLRSLIDRPLSMDERSFLTLSAISQIRRLRYTYLFVKRPSGAIPLHQETSMTDRSEKGRWLRQRCYACGHRLRFHSTACPQCGEEFDGRKAPKRYPRSCQCERCAPKVSHAS